MFIRKKLEKQADQIIAMDDQCSKLSDLELHEQTDIFKKRIENGESLDDILIEAFAVMREAAYRILGLKAFKVQLMGGIALHNGDIAEMLTGQGKTLTSLFPVYLNALEGKGVHVVTVNDYLAKRDCETNGRVLQFLGLTVGLNTSSLSPAEKKEVHSCDVTYTTNSELGFDYLRDNMVKNMDEKVLRNMHYALIDEVDSVLIDEARTPLIISGGEKPTAKMYTVADQFVKSLTLKDYTVDDESKTASLTESGIDKAEDIFKVDNLFATQNTALFHYITQALKANYTMNADVEYMVKDGKVMLIDSFTGRVMPDRSYSDGLQQAIEAKENVDIQEETSTLATITYQNFFRLFDKLAGMTGTAKTEEEEFMSIYNMRVVQIPPNTPVIREDRNDLIFSSASAKYKAIIKEVKKRHDKGQPVLIGTVAVETSEILSHLLSKAGIRHNVLNAKNHEKEAHIIAEAGQKNAVTIATNMAGRGTDIKLGEGVKELGGLAVIGSERHESRRIDNQLRGRSGRQGDPGFSQFYVSFDDDLMKRFAGERIQSFKAVFTDDEPIHSRLIAAAIESAQKKVEGQNFDSRKRVLEYDDVMRQQREIMYKQRDEIMSSDDTDAIMKKLVTLAVNNVIDAHTAIIKKKPVIDVDAVFEDVSKHFMAEGKLVNEERFRTTSDKNKIRNIILSAIKTNYINRAEDRTELERHIILDTIDRHWMDHIDAMTRMRNSIYLRSYAQRDPLQEYTQEGFYMFNEMKQEIAEEVTEIATHSLINHQNVQGMEGFTVPAFDIVVKI